MTAAAPTTAGIDPAESMHPSAAVADASNRLISELVEIRARRGREASQIEAMAMHNAAISLLRPDIGTAGVQRMLDLATSENRKISARDAKTALIGEKRTAARAQRRVRS